MSAFFLTGAVQTGKSTAIRRFFCANSALRRGGFLTVSIPTGTGFDVFIVPPVWTECDLTPDALVGRRGGAYEKRPEHFDGPRLRAARGAGVRRYLMDELGRMELDAHAFRRRGARGDTFRARRCSASSSRSIMRFWTRCARRTAWSFSR